jgi:hypothetical protein
MMTTTLLPEVVLQKRICFILPIKPLAFTLLLFGSLARTLLALLM